MDVREIVQEKFASEFLSGENLPEFVSPIQIISSEVLEVAEWPFDLDNVQWFVDRDIEEKVKNYQVSDELQRASFQVLVEREHRQRLETLAVHYARLLKQAVANGNVLNESTVDLIRTDMRESAKGRCDIYPCERAVGGTAST